MSPWSVPGKRESQQPPWGQWGTGSHATRCLSPPVGGEGVLCVGAVVFCNRSVLFLSHFDKLEPILMDRVTGEGHLGVGALTLHPKPVLCPCQAGCARAWDWWGLRLCLCVACAWGSHRALSKQVCLDAGLAAVCA